MYIAIQGLGYAWEGAEASQANRERRAPPQKQLRRILGSSIRLTTKKWVKPDNFVTASEIFVSTPFENGLTDVHFKRCDGIRWRFWLGRIRSRNCVGRNWGFFHIGCNNECADWVVRLGDQTEWLDFDFLSGQTRFGFLLFVDNPKEHHWLGHSDRCIDSHITNERGPISWYWLSYSL